MAKAKTRNSSTPAAAYCRMDIGLIESRDTCIWIAAILMLASLVCFIGGCDDAADTDDQSSGPAPGQMWNTYYYLVDQDEYAAGDNVTIVDIDCKPLAEVSYPFFTDLCDEGAARLSDGRLINNDRTCDCAPSCPLGYSVCFMVMDAEQFPWGVGSQMNPVTPLRSWAVDNEVIPFGTKLYAEQWDGVEIPNVDGLGGFTHDGCFSADDSDSISGRVKGDHYDFYAGTKAMWLALEQIMPTESWVDVEPDSARCDEGFND
jgi:3D (Asp-Asp-Asp) domain-containing protein